MKTVHGYDDTEKKLTLAQWEAATTEQRSGFLAEGYIVVNQSPNPSGNMGQRETPAVTPQNPTARHRVMLEKQRRNDAYPRLVAALKSVVNSINAPYFNAARKYSIRDGVSALLRELGEAE